MADYAYLPGLTTHYTLPSERETILNLADALSDFIVLTRKGLGVDAMICIDDLLESYKKITPSIHSLAPFPSTSGIDIGALIYCTNRLPTNITQVSCLSFCAPHNDSRSLFGKQNILKL